MTFFASDGSVEIARTFFYRDLLNLKHLICKSKKILTWCTERMAEEENHHLLRTNHMSSFTKGLICFLL